MHPDQYSSSSFILEILQHDHLLELFMKDDILGLQEALRCVVIFYALEIWEFTQIFSDVSPTNQDVNLPQNLTCLRRSMFL